MTATATTRAGPYIAPDPHIHIELSCLWWDLLS